MDGYLIYGQILMFSTFSANNLVKFYKLRRLAIKYKEGSFMEQAPSCYYQLIPYQK